MSVQAGMFCRDCLKIPPALGDGGYLGAPSLAQEQLAVPEVADSLPTFAQLYEPLAAIGLRTFECELFRDWLVAHDGHRVVLYLETEPPELEQLTSRPDWRREYVLEGRKRQMDSDAAVAAGVFKDATYLVRCSDCDVVLVAPEVERVRAFELLEVSGAAIEKLLERWTSIVNHNAPGAYRLMGILNTDEPFLEELIEFLRSHREHRVHAQLTEVGDN